MCGASNIYPPLDRILLNHQAGVLSPLTFFLYTVAPIIMFCRPSSVYVLAHQAINQAQFRHHQFIQLNKLGIELANTTLQDDEYDREQRLLALCMGSHRRLGCASQFSRLPEDLVHFISCELNSI